MHRCVFFNCWVIKQLLTPSAICHLLTFLFHFCWFTCLFSIDLIKIFFIVNRRIDNLSILPWNKTFSMSWLLGLYNYFFNVSMWEHWALYYILSHEILDIEIVAIVILTIEIILHKFEIMYCKGDLTIILSHYKTKRYQTHLPKIYM